MDHPWIIHGYIHGYIHGKNMASRVDGIQNFESRADETNAERHLGPANMPEVCECCSITSLWEHTADPADPTETVHGLLS